jgi:hypothetical protein
VFLKSQDYFLHKHTFSQFASNIFKECGLKMIVPNKTTVPTIIPTTHAVKGCIIFISIYYKVYSAIYKRVNALSMIFQQNYTHLCNPGT